MALIDQLKKIATARHSLNLLSVTMDRNQRRDHDPEHDYESVVVGDTGISKSDDAVFVAVDTVPVLRYDLHAHSITWKMHSPALESYVDRAVDTTVQRLEARERKDREWEEQRQKRDQAELDAFRNRFGIDAPAESQIEPMGDELKSLDERLRTYTKRHPGA